MGVLKLCCNSFLFFLVSAIRTMFAKAPKLPPSAQTDNVCRQRRRYRQPHRPTMFAEAPKLPPSAQTNNVCRSSEAAAIQGCLPTTQTLPPTAQTDNVCRSSEAAAIQGCLPKFDASGASGKAIFFSLTIPIKPPASFFFRWQIRHDRQSSTARQILHLFFFPEAFFFILTTEIFFLSFIKIILYFI